ncbi:uncharacterized protein LOC125803956 [Astyanax mexicanus]|uniref:uncharacterized protein LOC125803956 n=1 Tax=Astyanax mexicanus TaxID=7994 RepID=UPI0020CB45DB|nr:uncharacterized protein LOC125803956 [Astyanax mexicanus]
MKLRSSKHFIGYEDHEAAPIQSEAQESSGRQKRLDSFRSSSSLAEITMRVQNDLRKEQDEPARRQRSSTQRLSRSSSEIASPLVVQMVPRGRSVGGTSDPAQRTSKKAKSIAARTELSRTFDDEDPAPKQQQKQRKNTRRKTDKQSTAARKAHTEPLVKSDDEERAPRSKQKPRKNTRGKSVQNEPLLPQWLINLMFDIEEATKHELTVE